MSHKSFQVIFSLTLQVSFKIKVPSSQQEVEKQVEVTQSLQEPVQVKEQVQKSFKVTVQKQRQKPQWKQEPQRTTKEPEPQ